MPKTQTPETTEDAPLWVRTHIVLEQAYTSAYAQDVANAAANMSDDVRERALTRELRSVLVALREQLAADTAGEQEPEAGNA